MKHLTNSYWLSRNRKSRRDAQLQRLASMRAAKERKRLERGPHDEELRPVRWHRFEFGVKDKLTGETAWTDLRSVRHAATALRLLLQAERMAA